MPPAAITGVGFTASTTCGIKGSEATVPVWPPASVPCATIASTPDLRWRTALRTEPDRPISFMPWARARGSRKSGSPNPAAKIGTPSSNTTASTDLAYSMLTTVSSAGCTAGSW